VNRSAKPLPSSIHLAFYRAEHGRWLDRLVARHDRGPYSHVELVMSAMPRLGQPICFSSSWRDGGVRHKRIRLGGPDECRWDLLPVPVSPRDDEVLRRWCLKHVGGRYDLPGVLAFKLPFVRGRLTWWFCSEICVAAMQTAGHLPGERPESFSPNGLHRRWSKELARMRRESTPCSSF
jgi:hypothetical protein